MASLAEEFTQLDTRTRIEPGSRLIQNQNLGVMHQYACHPEALLHATGERLHHGIGFECQIREFENIRDETASALSGDAVSGREEFKILRDGHVLIDPKGVGHVSDEAPDPGAIGNRHLIDGRRTAVRTDDGG